MHTVGILLAAGASRRLGHPKQLVRLNARADAQEPTLVAQAHARLRAVTTRTIVTLGAHHEAVRAALPPGIHAVYTSDWAHGMSASIRAGLTEALACAPDLDAALITTCDQHHLTTASLQRLIDALTDDPDADASAAAYEDILGVPAAFRTRALSRILDHLRDDRGARDLLRSGALRVVPVPMPEAAHDLDTE